MGLHGHVLGAGGHVALHGQVGEIGFHLAGAHLGRMAFVVVEDELLHPVQIGFLGADGVVFDPDEVAGPVEELLFGHEL
jgi:hypothetical protein